MMNDRLSAAALSAKHGDPVARVAAYADEFTSDDSDAAIFHHPQNITIAAPDHPSLPLSHHGLRTLKKSAG